MRGPPGTYKPNLTLPNAQPCETLMTEIKKLSQTVRAIKYGPFDFFCFSRSEHEKDNFLYCRNPSQGDVSLLRVKSACYAAQISAALTSDGMPTDVMRPTCRSIETSRGRRSDWLHIC